MKRTSRHNVAGEPTTEVLIPMHADNWALSLGAGYIGPDPTKDRDSDIQSGLRNHILAFRERVPAIAVSGPSKVVLSAMLKIPTGQDDQNVVFLNDLVRVTAVKAARFETEAELKNFIASYSLFPDVPVQLIASVVGGFEVSLLEIEIPSEPVGDDIGAIRRRREYFGGLAAGLVELLSTSPFVAEITHFLGSLDQQNSVYSAASCLLEAFHKDATLEDKVIWSTTVEVLSGRASARGFDREELLEEISKRAAHKLDANAETLTVWVEICDKVIRSLMDPPALDDRRSIGQRAALGAILAPDFQTSSMLGTTIEVGPRVNALVTVAAYAFEGLSRVPSTTKNNREILDMICDLGEAIDHGTSSKIQITPRSITSEHEVVQKIFANERLLITSKREANAFERVMIEHLRQGIGIHLSEDGQLIVRSTEGVNHAFLEEFSNISGSAGVRIAVPIGVSASRHTAPQLKAYLQKAWGLGCSVGLRETAEVSELVVFDVLPLGDFNEESLSRTVEFLQTTAKQFASQPMKPVRAGRTGTKKVVQSGDPGESPEI